MPQTKKFKSLYIFEITGDKPLQHYVSTLLVSFLDGLSHLAGPGESLTVKIGKLEKNRKSLKKCIGEMTLVPYKKIED